VVLLVGVDRLGHGTYSPIQQQRNPGDDGEHSQYGTDALKRSEEARHQGHDAHGD
jgi:hypothetical protein